MPLSPGFRIKNCTQWPLTVSLDQVGPLYYGLVQPGEIFQRDTGLSGSPLKHRSRQTTNVILLTGIV